MLVSDDTEIISKVRYWSNQARSNVHWYEHEDIGFNYRMTSLSASLGLSQLRRFDSILAHRRHIHSEYSSLLASHPSIAVQSLDHWGHGNGWLTTVLIGANEAQASIGQIREGLLAAGIESRFLWKPLHRQPIFGKTTSWLNGTGDDLFGRGLCLPSSSGMSDSDVTRVVEALMSCVSSS